MRWNDGAGYRSSYTVSVLSIRICTEPPGVEVKYAVRMQLIDAIPNRFAVKQTLVARQVPPYYYA